MSKFKPYRKDQLLLFPNTINDFVPKSHLARLVDQIVEELNTTNIEKKYSSLGQNTYHPKILIKLLFYGYAVGERSGRTIAKKIETDTAYMYLSQMYRPDFRTVNDFRKNHIKELSEYFLEIVRYCQKLNLVKVGQINIDGTKMKANASSRRTKNKQQCEQWIERIEKKIKQMLEEASQIDAQEDALYGNLRGDELPRQINTAEKLKKKLEEISQSFKDNKEEINITDQDAPRMQKVKVGYNCQAAVTEEQIIVGAEVITDTNDKEALKPTVEATEETLHQTIHEVAADSGYASFGSYEYLSKNKKTGYIPDQDLAMLGKNKMKTYHYENFTYDQQQDAYLCPRVQVLTRYKRWFKDKNSYTIYRGKSCQQCPEKAKCTKQNQRTIAREDRRPLLEQMRQRLQSQAGQQKYLQRMLTIEPTFGNIKHNLGYRYFLLRTLEKVKGEFKLMCIAHNHYFVKNYFSSRLFQK